jgi:hypothetical protein
MELVTDRRVSYCKGSAKKQREKFGNMALGYGLNGPVFQSTQGLGIFLLTPTSGPALGPAQPPIKRVPGALSLVVKRTGCAANHSPPCSVDVKNAWRSYTSIPVIRLHGVVLNYKKSQG